MGEGACGRDGRPPDSGWLKLTEHRSAISAGGNWRSRKAALRQAKLHSRRKTPPSI
jgi:hypothetical protein